MKYDKFTYLYPPRPTTAVEYLGDTYQGLKSRNWITQFKLNGSRNMIYISPDGDIEFWNRHGERPRNYTPPDWLLDELREHVSWGAGKWTVIDGELLHLKHASVKNTLYLFDILVLNSELLLYQDYAIRYEKLINILSPLGYDDIASRVSEHIWVANNILPADWDNYWSLTQNPIIEGFVFKNPKGVLKPMFTAKNNSDWMVRCRKSTKSYAF